ncbi:GerMN domain-containing protein [Aureibacillus halotolerans]|uniref:Germination protein M n=1 Tax=Aureibacillus halotolerans TaxID=1508390 RepID=A0A4R6U0J6_9BACI|nr:GerMN domain-containing protein [Aureibacillus halotolerans]TDQ39186.1 germination protein M [Aureibacillus halotolerans]
MRAHRRHGLMAILFCLFATVLAGCMFQGEKETAKQIDPPPEMTIEKQPSDGEGSGEEGANTPDVREVYLLDANGYVVPQTLPLPATDEVAKQALEYMVTGGPVTELLPNGFQAVLPQGTVINGVDIREDGTAVVDFSNEFASYAPESERQILEAITWTLTQFDTIDKVNIWINGFEQDVMPVNHEPIHGGVTREMGINIQSSDVTDIRSSEPVTVYYVAQHDKTSYYVPVTKRVDSDRLETEEETAQTIVEELVKGPGFETSLLTGFHPDTELTANPEIDAGTVYLQFTAAVLSGNEQPGLSNQVLEPLVLSLTEVGDVKQVSVDVNSSEEGDLVVEEVVSRPAVTNQGKF